MLRTSATLRSRGGIATTVALATVLVALVGACTSRDPGPTPNSPTPSIVGPVTVSSMAPSPTGSPLTVVATPTDFAEPGRVDFANPTAVARAFAITYFSRAWNDQPANQWLQRTRPYLSTPFATQLTSTTGNGPGAAWQQYVDAHCVSTSQPRVVQLVDEAPRTSTSVWYDVVVDVVTTTAAGRTTTEPQAVVVNMILDNGRWLVNRVM